MSWMWLWNHRLKDAAPARIYAQILIYFLVSDSGVTARVGLVWGWREEVSLGPAGLWGWFRSASCTSPILGQSGFPVPVSSDPEWLSLFVAHRRHQELRWWNKEAAETRRAKLRLSFRDKEVLPLHQSKIDSRSHRLRYLKAQLPCLLLFL